MSTLPSDRVSIEPGDMVVERWSSVPWPGQTLFLLHLVLDHQWGPPLQDPGMDQAGGAQEHMSDFKYMLAAVETNPSHVLCCSSCSCSFNMCTSSKCQSPFYMDPVSNETAWAGKCIITDCSLSGDVFFDTGDVLWTYTGLSPSHLDVLCWWWSFSSVL